MRNRSIACILCVLCLPLLAASFQQEPPAPAKKPPAEQLLIGLAPEQNIFKQIERYEPLMGGATTAGCLLPLEYFHQHGISNYKGFTETRNEEYDIIVKYAGDIHLNLSAYDYTND